MQVNTSESEFNKKFCKMASTFLILDIIVAVVCFPKLMLEYECPSIIRLWVFLDIVLMILLVPNIYYQYKVSIHNEERAVISIIKYIHESHGDL
jgi:NADH:ubiquinone oxidoreductase subunit 3 (subunit A)